MRSGAAIVTESYKQNEHVIPILQHSRALKAVCEQITVRVEDDELMVGNRGKYFCGNSVEPEWSGGGWALASVRSGAYTLKEDGLYHNPEGEDLDIVIAPEDVEILAQVDEWWQQGHIFTTVANAWLPEGYDELCSMCVSANKSVQQPVMMMTAGHMTPGYQKILTVGYGAIRKQAQDWLAAHRNDIMGDEMKKISLLHCSHRCVRRCVCPVPPVWRPVCGKGGCLHRRQAQGRAGDHGRQPGLDRRESCPDLLAGLPGGADVPPGAGH